MEDESQGRLPTGKAVLIAVTDPIPPIFILNSPGFQLLLLKARSVCNKAALIHNLIVIEAADLT